MYVLLIIDSLREQTSAEFDRIEGCYNLLKFIDASNAAAAEGKETQRLSHNCWLIPLHSEWRIFMKLIDEAERWGESYRVAFFAEPPSWCGTTQVS